VILTDKMGFVDKEGWSGARDVIELIKQSGSWVLRGDAWESRIYPKPKFAGSGRGVSWNQSLRVADRVNLRDLTVLMDSASPVSDLPFADYLIRPHLFVPDRKLVVTDQHRFLPSIMALLKETGLRIKKAASIDLDYFSRIPSDRIGSEMGRLMTALGQASKVSDIVVADSHVDGAETGKSVLGWKGSYKKIVEMTDDDQVKDENCLLYLPEGKISLILPPIISQAYNTGEQRGIEVSRVGNFEGGVEPQTVWDLLEKIDLLHVCTSPGYIDPKKSMEILLRFL
jgi:hypothetical protein